LTLPEKSPPGVVYALAEAKGIKLYFALTEGGVVDRIVTPDQARTILHENGLLPKP
jgi:hypothetical protein